VLTDLTKTNQTSSDNSEHRHFAHREDILQTRKNHSSWFPTDRIALLVTLWKSPNYSDFTSATYQAIRECILRQKESNKNFLRIGNISLELRVWLKDTFNLKQEALTSAITASGIFQHPPHIVGNSWTGLGLEWVIQNVKPIDGIKRPDDAVSAFLRATADRTPTTGAIRVPWLTLEQATAIHQQDYIPLTRDRYATPTLRNPLEWHDMTQEDLMDTSKIPSVTTAHPHQQVPPWSHNTLIVLRETCVGALSDVWPKINATQQAGKRVLLVLQDPPAENKKHSRTQEFFNNMNGQVVAYFPTGTIPFGHACGWSNAHTSWNGNSHSWILKNGEQIRPPTDVHQDCMQRHAKLMNSSRVRFIIFPAHNDNTHKMLDIDNGRLRRLAYLIGGIGYLQYKKPISWTSNNKQTSLAWSNQGSDRELDFTIPWRMCMWQSSRKLTPSALEQNATPIHSDQILAQRQQQRLHSLSANNRPIDTIPDGA